MRDSQTPWRPMVFCPSVTEWGNRTAAGPFPTLECPRALSFRPATGSPLRPATKPNTKALTREPALEAEAMRREDTERCEEIFSSLQPGLSKGTPRVRVLDHKARINGYASLSQIEVGGKGGQPLSIAVGQCSGWTARQTGGIIGCFKASKSSSELNADGRKCLRTHDPNCGAWVRPASKPPYPAANPGATR